MYCSNCGKKIENDEKYCGSCGTITSNNNYNLIISRPNKVMGVQYSYMLLLEIPIMN